LTGGGGGKGEGYELMLFWGKIGKESSMKGKGRKRILFDTTCIQNSSVSGSGTEYTSELIHLSSKHI
jgi:hypothetical protein